MGEKKTARTFMFSVFVIFAALVLVLNMVSLYFSIETMSFWGFPDVGRMLEEDNLGARLTIQGCTPFIKAGESKTITSLISNKSDRVIKGLAQAVISKDDTTWGHVHFEKAFELAPGETQEIDWTVSDQNLVKNRLQVRLFMGESLGLSPSLTKPCRMTQFGLPGLSSDASAILLYSLAMVVMATATYGIYKLDNANSIRPLPPRRVLIFTLALSVLMTATTYLNSVLFGIVFAIVMLQGVLAMLQMRIDKPGK